MAHLETIKVDIIQETIHNQIKKLAKTAYEQSGVMIHKVNINWNKHYLAGSVKPDKFDFINVEITSTKG